MTFACGSRGLILSRDSRGWQRHDAGTTQLLSGIWGASPRAIFVVGNSGTLLRYDGKSWTKHDEPCRWRRGRPPACPIFTSVWGSGPKSVFAVGDGGAIWRFNGKSFVEEHSGVNDRLASVWGRGPNDVFAVGLNGTITHFDGGRWTRQPSGTTDYLRAVMGSVKGDVLALSSKGKVLRFDGKRWSAHSQLKTREAHHLWIAGPKSMFAATFDGIWRFAGGDWTMQYRGDYQFPTALAGSDPRDIVAVGYSGLILGFDGQSWRAAGTHYQQLSDVSGHGADEVLAVGWDTAWRHDAAGWHRVPIVGAPPRGYAPSKGKMNALWVAKKNVAFAAGGWGSVLRYDGERWRVMTQLSHQKRLEGIWGSAVDDIFVVGAEGTIDHFDGRAWTSQSSGTKARLLDIWGRGPTDVFAVGERGTLLHYDGKRWSPRASGTMLGLHSIWGSDGVAFAVGGNGVVLRHEGSSWQLVAQPGKLSANTLRAVGGHDAQTVYAVGNGGSVLHFDGKRWRRQQSGTHNGLRGVWANPKGVFVVGLSGTTLHRNR